MQTQSPFPEPSKAAVPWINLTFTLATRYLLLDTNIMSGIGKQIGSDVMAGLKSIPKDIVNDAKDQVGLPSESVPSSDADPMAALEQGQSSSDDPAQAIKQQQQAAQEQAKTQSKLAQVRANLKRIESEIEQHRQERLRHEKDRDDTWEQMLEQDKAEAVEERQEQAHWDAVKDMNRQRSGAGEGSKKKH